MSIASCRQFEMVSSTSGCLGIRISPENAAMAGVVESAPSMGTSEAPMRNQMKAWAEYMGAR